MGNVGDYKMAPSLAWVWRVRVEQGWETNREGFSKESSPETKTESLEEFEYKIRNFWLCWKKQ